MKALLATLFLCVACTTPGGSPGGISAASADKTPARGPTSDSDFEEPYDPGPRPLFYMTNNFAGQHHREGAPACAITAFADYQWPILVLYDDGLLIRSVMTDTRQENRRTYAATHLNRAAIKAFLDTMPGRGDLKAYDPVYGEQKARAILHRYVSWTSGKRQDVRLYVGSGRVGAPPELLATFDRVLAETGGGSKAFVPGGYDVWLVPHTGDRPKKGAKWPEEAPSPASPSGGSVFVNAAAFDTLDSFRADCDIPTSTRIDNRWYDARVRAYFRQQHLWLTEAPGTGANLALLRSNQPRTSAEARVRIDAAVKEAPALAPKLLRHRDGITRAAGAGAVLRGKIKGVDRQLTALLNDKNALARTQAAAALLDRKQDKGQKASRAVIRGLKGPEEETKLVALRALQSAPRKLVKPKDVSALLTDSSPDVRLEAANQFMHFANGATPAVVDAVKSALDAPYAETRSQALRVLGQAAKLAGPVVPKIAARLDDGDDRVRLDACRALDLLREAGVATASATKALERLARRTDTEVADCAYTHLVHHATTEQLDDVLTLVLGRESPPQWAIDASARTKDAERIKRLGPVIARLADEPFVTDALHPLDVLIHYQWKPATTLTLARRQAAACAGKACSKRSAKIVDSALQISENK